MQARWVSVGLLIAISGSACKREQAHDEAQAVDSTPKQVDTVNSGWDSLETARLSGVRYSPPAQVFGVLGVPSGEYFDSIGPGYKIGTFVDGKYRGADLVSAERRNDEPCKGEGCDETTYLRFVRNGKELVFLRQNSDGGEYFDRNKATWQRFVTRHFSRSASTGSCSM